MIKASIDFALKYISIKKCAVFPQSCQQMVCEYQLGFNMLPIWSRTGLNTFPILIRVLQDMWGFHSSKGSDVDLLGT